VEHLEVGKGKLNVVQVCGEPKRFVDSFYYTGFQLCHL